MTRHTTKKSPTEDGKPQGLDAFYTDEQLAAIADIVREDCVVVPEYDEDGCYSPIAVPEHPALFLLRIEEVLRRNA